MLKTYPPLVKHIYLHTKSGFLGNYLAGGRGALVTIAKRMLYENQPGTPRDVEQTAVDNPSLKENQPSTIQRRKEVGHRQPNDERKPPADTSRLKENRP